MTSESKRKVYPITEALIDIWVELPSVTTLDTLLFFQEKIKSSFPHNKLKQTWQGGFHIKNGIPEIEKPSSKLEGYLFFTSEGNKIVQARFDGFTFNKLKPYEDWESFRDESKMLWNHYKDSTLPIKINKIGIRYINRIEIPLPIGDFSEYFLTRPEIAPELPQELSGFLMRLVMPLPEIEKTCAIVTQTFESPTENDILPYIFDIHIINSDVFEPDSDRIWNTIESQKEVLNRIFKESITPKTRELFYEHCSEGQM